MRHFYGLSILKVMLSRRPSRSDRQRSRGIEMPIFMWATLMTKHRAAAVADCRLEVLVAENHQKVLVVSCHQVSVVAECHQTPMGEYKYRGAVEVDCHVEAAEV